MADESNSAIGSPAAGKLRDPRRRRILIRTVALCWVTVLFTVAVYTLTIIPYQKAQLLQALRERAQVAYTSTAQVAVNAIVMEDYSPLVEHCLKLVRENPSLLYMVLTRRDGFSLVHKKDGWSQEQLGGTWVSEGDTDPRSGHFVQSDLVQREVYCVVFPFSYSGIDWGWVHVGLSPETFYRDVRSLYTRIFWVALLAVSTGFAASFFFARRLSHPILALDRFTRRVAAGDLSSHLEITSGDEVESLADSFNQMVDALRRSKEDLVAAHKELLGTARQAGMAEVATGVLHNVGNSLNSVGVTTSSIQGRIRHWKAVNLAKVSGLLQEHKADLGHFVTQDERGRNLPEYIHGLAQQILKDQETLLQDLDELDLHLHHVKEIIALQQSYGKSAGLTESVLVSDLLENALRLNADALVRHRVDVRREYADLPACLLDRHRILQVLTNLISNGKYAVSVSERRDKILTIRSRKVEPDRLVIEVVDNGIGIAEENLTRVFGHGFTTKKGGHGFGLHSGALAAREMEGSLTVQSAGAGKGATFTLDLPFRPQENAR